MKTYTYRNRYGDVFTFELDSDGNLLWKGNFEFARYGFEEAPDNLNSVDPSGGPYIDIGTDMGKIHEDLKGYEVTGFIRRTYGYKLTILKKKDTERDLYQELRRIGLTHDHVSEVLDWLETVPSNKPKKR